MEKKKIYEPMRLPKTRKKTDRDRDYHGDLSWLWAKIDDLEKAGWKRENYGWYLTPRRTDSENKKIEESKEYIVLSRTKNLVQLVKETSTKGDEKLCQFANWHNLKNRKPLKYQGFSTGSNSCMAVHSPVLNPSLCSAENLPEFSALSDARNFPSLAIVRRGLPETFCISYDSEWCKAPSGADTIVSHQFSFVDAAKGDLITYVFLPVTGRSLDIRIVIGYILGYFDGQYKSFPAEDYYVYDCCTAWDEERDKPIITTYKTFSEAKAGGFVYIHDGRKWVKKPYWEMPIEEQKAKRNKRSWAFFNRRLSDEVVKNRIKIAIIAHFGKVDLRNLGCDDGYNILRHCTDVQGGLVTLEKPIILDAVDVRNTTTHGYKHYPVSLSIRDTLCHAPAGEKSLDALGKAIKYPKVEIPKEDKSNMGAYLMRDPVGYLHYAATDSEVTLLYISSLYGYNVLPPVTVTSAASKYYLYKQADYLNLVVKGKIDMIGYNKVARGLQKVCKGLVPAEGRAEFITATNLEPISNDAKNVQELASCAYHGGLNCCTMPGLYNGLTTYDVDLQSAYPTPMVLIPDLDWQSPILEEIRERELTLKKFVDPTTGIISPMPLFVGCCRFEFPATVNQPCLPVPFDGSLVYPLRSDDEVYLAGPEVILALKLGAKIYCVEGYFLRPLMRPDPDNPLRMDLSYSMRSAVMSLVRERNTAKKMCGLKSLEQSLLKLFSNGGYGKYAQAVTGKRAWRIAKQEMEALGPSPITNPVTACLITSTVRAVLLAAMNQVHDAGYKWMSTTTDGGITTAPLDVIDGLDLYGLRDYLGYGRKMITEGQSAALWEIKHAQDDLLNLTRRGNVSLYTSDNPYTAPNGKSYPGVCARNGWRSFADQQKGSIEDRREFRTLCLTRTGRITANKSGFTSLKEMTLNDAKKRKPLLHEHAESKLRMDFEFSRKPIRESFAYPTENVCGIGYEVATFDTEPFADVHEYAKYRQKNSTMTCLRTQNDWDQFWSKIDLDAGRAKPRNEAFARVFSCVMGWRKGLYDVPFLASKKYSVAQKCDILNQFCDDSRTFKTSDWKNSKAPARQANMLPYEEIAEVLEKLQAIPADPDDGSVE